MIGILKDYCSRGFHGPGPTDGASGPAAGVAGEAGAVDPGRTAVRRLRRHRGDGLPGLQVHDRGARGLDGLKFSGRGPVPADGPAAPGRDRRLRRRRGDRAADCRPALDPRRPGHTDHPVRSVAGRSSAAAPVPHAAADQPGADVQADSAGDPADTDPDHAPLRRLRRRRPGTGPRAGGGQMVRRPHGRNADGLAAADRARDSLPGLVDAPGPDRDCVLCRGLCAFGQLDIHGPGDVPDGPHDTRPGGDGVPARPQEDGHRAGAHEPVAGAQLLSDPRPAGSCPGRDEGPDQPLRRRLWWRHLHRGAVRRSGGVPPGKAEAPAGAAR